MAVNKYMKNKYIYSETNTILKQFSLFYMMDIDMDMDIQIKI